VICMKCIVLFFMFFLLFLPNITLQPNECLHGVNHECRYKPETATFIPVSENNEHAHANHNTGSNVTFAVAFTVSADPTKIIGLSIIVAYLLYAAGHYAYNWWTGTRSLAKQLEYLQKYCSIKESHPELYAKRIEMFGYSMQACNKKREYIRHVDDRALTMARFYKIDTTSLAKYYMTSYQHQLNNEFIEQLSIAALLKPIYTDKHNADYAVLFDALGYGISFGIEANRHDEITTANYWADYGWQLIDMLKAVGQGVGQGVINAVTSTAHMVIHPMKTIKSVVHTMGFIAKHMARAAGKVGDLLFLAECGELDALEAQTQKIVTHLGDTAQYCVHAARKIPIHETVKHISALGTEIAITGKIIPIAGSLCNRLTPLAAHALKAIDKEKKLQKAFAVGSKQARNAITDKVQKAGIAVGEVISDARRVFEQFHAQYMG
jgi:hypothetical protein